MAYRMNEFQPILDFWFRGEKSQKFWWTKDSRFDREVKEKFQKVLEEIKRGEHDEWKDNSKGLLALVVVLDQFSRNIYRGTAKAYEGDIMAQTIVKEGIKRGEDTTLTPVERSMFYMPLMHAEDEELQKLSLEKFTKLDTLTGSGTTYAKEHKKQIDRYGRFPKRNKILKRTSTSAEKIYLAKFGAGF